MKREKGAQQKRKKNRKCLCRETLIKSQGKKRDGDRKTVLAFLVKHQLGENKKTMKARLEGHTGCTPPFRSSRGKDNGQLPITDT